MHDVYSISDRACTGFQRLEGGGWGVAGGKLRPKHVVANGSVMQKWASALVSLRPPQESHLCERCGFGSEISSSA